MTEEAPMMMTAQNDPEQTHDPTSKDHHIKELKELKVKSLQLASFIDQLLLNEINEVEFPLLEYKKHCQMCV
jgi:hypothetical protein